MLFRLYNACKILQRLISFVFAEVLNEFVIIYLDNILIYSDLIEAFYTFVNDL